MSERVDARAFDLYGRLLDYGSLGECFDGLAAEPGSAGELLHD